jgi:hypothetical protein
MRLLFLILISFLLFSCNDNKKENTDTSNEVLEDFSKMPDSIFLAGFEYSENLSGKSYIETLSLLKSDTGVSEIASGDNTISFRIHEGPLMLLSFGKADHKTKGFSTGINSSFEINGLKDDDDYNVVAAQRDNRQNKKALVLVPYEWQFGTDDDALVALNKLKNHRNYKGGITYKANKTASQQNISLDDYATFDNYDLIHFSSHGSNTCILRKDEIEIISGGESNMCYTFLSSGIKILKKDLLAFKKQLVVKGFQGLAFSPSEEEGWFDVDLRPQFFKTRYSSLQNKLIIFSACELGQNKDLQNTFESILENGQMFYWQNVVNAEDAKVAFEMLYDRMLKYGETAPVSFNNIPPNLKDNLPSFFLILNDENKYDTIKTTTYLQVVNKGNAMHLIEPISFIDEKTKKELQEGVVYPFEGILEDDQPEEASFTLEFLGYTKQEMEEKNMSFSLKIDGTTVLDRVPFLPDNDPNDDIEVSGGKNEKTTLVTFKATNLKKDLKKNSSVKLEGYFHFSDENYGYQSINVSTGSSDMRIVMKSPDGNINMFFDADNYGLKITYPAENATLYSDEAGYIYMNAPGQGWIKTKMSQIFGVVAKLAPIDIDFMALETNKGSVMHKIPGFAAEATISKLEKEPRAKKISGGIGSEKTVFVADGRVTITFDGQKRLESIVEGPVSMRYYYENQNITLPNAKTFTMPSFN